MATASRLANPAAGVTLSRFAGGPPPQASHSVTQGRGHPNQRRPYPGPLPSNVIVGIRCRGREAGRRFSSRILLFLVVAVPPAPQQRMDDSVLVIIKISCLRFPEGWVSLERGNTMFHSIGVHLSRATPSAGTQ
jgi:hypothetical protein